MTNREFEDIIHRACDRETEEAVHLACYTATYVAVDKSISVAICSDLLDLRFGVEDVARAAWHVVSNFLEDEVW